MTGHKSIIGALVLCALASCAFVAQGASAAGLTAYTCEKGTGGQQYSDSHCETKSATGEFHTAAIVGTAESEGEAVKRKVGETETAKSELISAVAGVNVNVTCEHAVITGKVTNTETGGVMDVHGTEVRVHYTECHAVLVSAPTRTCTVRQGAGGTVGTLTTNKLTTLTRVEGEKHLVTLEPENAAEPFIEFELLQAGGTNCPAGLNEAKVKVTGMATGESPTGKPTHLTFSGKQSGLLVNGATEPEYNGTYNGYKMGSAGAITLALET